MLTTKEKLVIIFSCAVLIVPILGTLAARVINKGLVIIDSQTEPRISTTMSREMFLETTIEKTERISVVTLYANSGQTIWSWTNVLKKSIRFLGPNDNHVVFSDTMGLKRSIVGGIVVVENDPFR